MLENLTTLTESPLYICLVVFVLMPMVGALMVRDKFLIGFLLILTQVPWFLNVVIFKIID
jgi:hypothetical protein